MSATRTSFIDVKWAIVEQPAHVEAGTREFADAHLSFHSTIEEACEREQFEVLLLSGVLQCLQDPFQLLGSLLERQFPAIILDRTPFIVGDRRRLTVQHVPKCIYPATYPSWFFAESELLANFLKCYDKVATWPALDKHHPEGGRAQYKGFLFELKKPS
jgi:putative methyltransferase (TIGR04325 family)